MCTLVNNNTIVKSVESIQIYSATMPTRTSGVWKSVMKLKTINQCDEHTQRRTQEHDDYDDDKGLGRNCFPGRGWSPQGTLCGGTWRARRESLWRRSGGGASSVVLEQSPLSGDEAPWSWKAFSIGMSIRTGIFALSGSFGNSRKPL